MLSKRQLIQAAKQDYMSRDQLDYFKSLLEQQKNSVKASIRSCRDTLLDNDIESDPLDTASQEEIKQITLLRVQRDTYLLHQIELALERIYTGDYGYCEETGDQIGVRRLLANPLTTLCIEACQNEEFRIRVDGVSKDELDHDSTEQDLGDDSAAA